MDNQIVRFNQNRFIALSIALICLIAPSFYGCFVGYTLNEFQDSEPIENGKSSLTLGYPDIRFQFPISDNDEVGASLWSVNMMTYILKPNTFYDVGLKLNWKHSFTENRSRSMFAFLMSGFIYKAFVTDVFIGSTIESSNRIRYQGYGFVPGVIYSYRFKYFEEESNQFKYRRFPLWLISAHSVYGGVKVNGLFGRVSKQYSWNTQSKSFYRKDFFVSPFIGVCGGTDQKRVFAEINTLVALDNYALTFKQTFYLSGGISYVFDF